MSSPPPPALQTQVTGQNLIRGATGYTVALVLSAVAGLISMRIHVTYLGKIEYGMLLLTGTISAWGVVGNLGLSNAIRQRMTSLLAQNRVEDASRCLASGVATLALIGSVLMAACLVAHFAGWTRYLVPDDITDAERGARLIFLGVVLFLIRFPFNPFGNVLLSRNQILAHNVFQIVFSVTHPIAVFVTLQYTRSLTVLLLVQAIHQWLDLVLRYAYVLRQVPALRFRFSEVSRSVASSLITPSISFLIIQLGFVVVYRTSNVVIGIMLGAGYIASYAAAFRIFSILREICVSGIEVLFPAAAILDARGERERLREYLTIATRISLTLSVLGGAGLVYLGDPFIAAWLDQPDLAPGRGTLVALGILLPVGVFVNAMGRAVTGVGRHHRQALIYVVEMVLNLGLSIYLAPRMGIAGVALATLLARAVVTVLYTADAVHTLDLDMKRIIQGALLPNLIVAGALIALGETLPLPTGAVSPVVLVALIVTYAALCAAVFALLLPRPMRDKLLARLRRRRPEAGS